ncbi:MAG: ribosome biogenesis GTPase Der [Actinobacteria bacterium]|nr:ribosome biogenesis GTPase Der [Actinomycetota bacterium]
MNRVEGRIVAIDGPSGVGKSTVARGVADALDVPHIDTGALYRAVTLAVLRAGVDPHDEDATARVAEQRQIERRDGRTYLDGDDVDDQLRGDGVTAAVSAVSAHPGVRAALIDVQRDAVLPGGGVVEGRDIGTVVFPDADLKVWLTADADERARRRAAQQDIADQSSVAAELARRDATDAGRSLAPLAKAEDAWEIDTTDMSPGETIQAVVALARAVWGQEPHEEPEAPPQTEQLDQAALDAAALRAIAPTRRALPRVAVIGRPNVGKSTFVNRVIGHRAAIVEQKPGVTRDRTEHVATWRGRAFTIVDTGGWEHGADGMAGRVVEQAEKAVAEADLAIFLVDATVGALADDERYAKLLRRAGTPVLLVANKVDSPKQEPLIHELYGLGLGDPLPVSAAHGRAMGDVLDAIVDVLPEDTPESPPDESGIPRVAVVGRPNVGKSSLFNQLLGEERSIVDPVPHTTRDAVDTLVTIDGEPWVFVDTAGLRRRYRHGEDTELYSADRTRRAVETADLALFVVDGSEPIGEQDQRLAAMVRDAGCGIVLAVNKWDLVDDERRSDLERELERLLGFAGWAPRVNVSALTGRGVGRIVPWLRKVYDAYRTRIPTGELNTWLGEVTERVPPPPGPGGRSARLKYVTQPATGPPTLVLFGSGQLTPAYQRYLERTLRERYGLVGTPVRLRLRGGRRAERSR